MPKSGLIIHEHAENLPQPDQDLLRRAADNHKLAYAPYSNFLVGAALRTRDGRITGGANQENASYPLCMCGERVALYNSTIQFPGAEIDTIAIVVKGTHPMVDPAPPCGACLQVIREFESRQNEKPIRLLLKADSDIVWEVSSAKTMLPYSFDGSYLNTSDET
jgi:cytidine deaminase